MARGRKSAGRKTAAIEGPNPIDIYVGNRVRLRRTLLGLSQTHLGRSLNLTFQQVQKYEKGLNRIGSSRLFELSRILGVPVTYFFEGVSETSLSRLRGRGGLSENRSAYEDDPMLRRETLELVRAYYKIPNAAIRKRIFELTKSLSGNEVPRR